MWFFAAFILFVIACLFLKYKKFPLQERLNPYSCKSPLTPTEVKFYGLLIAALPEYLVLPQVQLSSFIKVDKSITGPRNFYTYFNPVAQQSVDYLICKQDFSIVAAIELDDRSHNSPVARNRDEKKNDSLAKAGIRLIRWHAESMPNPEEIRVALWEVEPKSETTEPYINTGYDYLTGFLIDHSKNVASNVIKATLIKGAFLLVGVAIAVYLISQLPGYFVKAAKSFVPATPVTETAPLKARPSIVSGKVIPPVSNNEAAPILEPVTSDTKNTRIYNEALKEEAWKKYFHQSSSCEKGINLVDCGNQYIRAKKKFETEWADGKL